MTTTISDVARRAGVSPATVSRVLTGSAKVTDETRQRVMDVVDELGYRPSAVAQSLRRRSTAVLGLVVTDITNPFYPEVVRGAEDAAAAAGRSVLLCNSAEDPEREVGYLDALEDQRIDALVVASTGMWTRHRERLLEFRAPVVLLHQPSDAPTVSSVANDDAQGGRLAAQHLLDRGHRPLVYIGGPSDAASSSDRYRSAVATAGVDIPQVSTDGHVPQGHAAMLALAEDLTPPFGVFAHNDLTAIGVLSALAELGWSVPDEVGVVGFDDLEVARFVQPPLTTIRQDKYEMGAEAIRIAIRQLHEGAEPEQTVLPTTLIERRSTRPAPDGDATRPDEVNVP